MKNTMLTLKLATFGAIALLVVGCGGGDDTAPAQALLSCPVPQVPNATGTACVAPTPLKCTAPEFPDAKKRKLYCRLQPEVTSANGNGRSEPSGDLL